MHAIILAAGRALRLRGFIDQRPKGLLEIDGRSLLDYSLDNLVSRGVTGITIVTGHCEGMIQRSLGSQYRGAPIEYVFNPDHASTGSVISLLVGAELVNGSGVLVVESDLLYHPGFVDAAVSASESTVLVADQSGSGDEVFICANKDGYLDYLGKAATPRRRRDSLGEYAGLAVVSEELLSAYCNTARKLKIDGSAGGHYEELLFELSRDGFAVHTHHCPSLPWTEVDTAEDFYRAKTKIYPRLRHLWESQLELSSPVS